MRSYYEHLDTASGKAQTAIQPKPTLRSSAIFPVLQFPGVQSRVIFMGYWMLKRNIREIAALATLRSAQGKILSRQNFLITEAKTYRIELADQLAAAGVSADENFIGSLEIEFFSTANLVFPYPAVVINYYGPHFSTVVHVAQRTYNDYEDMKRNSQTDVPESGFNIYADENKEPFISLINGSEAAENIDMALEFYNMHGENLKQTLQLGAFAPYETKLIYPARQIQLKEFLKGGVGAGKAKFRVNWIFPRLVVGNLLNGVPALMITHSYYDTTRAVSDGDYWMANQPEWFPASLIVPALVKEPYFTAIYFYPIYSPAHFAVDVEIFAPDGTLLGSKKQAMLIKSPYIQLRGCLESHGQGALLLNCPRNAEGYVHNFFAILKNMAKKLCTFLGQFSKQISRPRLSRHPLKRLDIKAICQELNIQPANDLGVRLNAYPLENRLPARIKIGLDLGHAPQIPCNICTNLQPFNPPLENKPKTFRWAPVLADQPKPMLWIMNSAPNIHYTKQADIELTFFHEKDEATLKRHLTLAPHGFAVIYPNQDPELQAFFSGNVGWFTAVSNNPYTTTYYFAESDAGLIGGDHGF